MSFINTFVILNEHTAPWWEDPLSDILELDDGSIACCGQQSAHVNIWCPNTGNMIKEINFKGNISSINRMALLKNGMLACGDNDGSLVICEATTGLNETELEGHDNSIKALYILKDGSLVSYSYGHIKIWNYIKRQLLKEIKYQYSGLDEQVCAELILSNDQFILTENDGPILDVSGDEWDKQLGFDIGDIFYCDKSRILGVDQHEQLYSLNEKRGKTIISRKTGNGTDCVTKIASLNDGRVLTGHENGLVTIWDRNSHLAIRLFDNLPIDNFFVMKDNRIITIACDQGKIWSVPINKN